MMIPFCITVTRPLVTGCEEDVSTVVVIVAPAVNVTVPRELATPPVKFVAVKNGAKPGACTSTAYAPACKPLASKLPLVSVSPPLIFPSSSVSDTMALVSGDPSPITVPDERRSKAEEKVLRSMFARRSR